MSPLILTPVTFDMLRQHCESQWPREACGLIFAGATLRVIPMVNLQDQLHQHDPVSFPRDGHTAYVMDPLQVQNLVDDAEARGDNLLAIFHSHPQHPAYFSVTDQRAAMPFGMPTFPLTWQVVLSVYNAQVVEVKGFYWEETSASWKEGVVGGLPDLPGSPPGAEIFGDI